MSRQVRPYGTWRSPIAPESIASSTLRLTDLQDHRGALYWIEGRPHENGRQVVVRREGAGVVDLIPPPFNARTKVHEYGGRSFGFAGDRLVFSNFADQALYRARPGDVPELLSDEPATRFADFVHDAPRDRLIAVAERHHPDGEPANLLAGVDLGSGRVEPLVEGADFYSTPRLSPSGTHLAWLSWRHPNMPWDGTDLWMAALEPDGSIVSPVRIAGGDGESIFQPEWSPGGVLYFVSDRDGWWNLYRLAGGTVERVTALEAEFGRPQWIFGNPTYGFLPDDRVACAFAQAGTWRVGLLDLPSGHLTPCELPYTEIGHLTPTADGRVAFIGGAPDTAPGVVLWDTRSGRTELVRSASDFRLDPAYVSQPRAISYLSRDGATAHALYYAPWNPEVGAPAGERPPLRVIGHGGPTAAASSSLDLDIQFWTTRGIGVLDVNYGGSTGYGRAYRERLNGNWGVVDVDDCLAGALHLVAEGLADPERLIIRGGSAGGYTVLCALAFRQGFRIGVSYYGVSDLEGLATDTHKFESRYLDRLVGPYPEKADVYRDRSPLRHADRIATPVLFLQGDEDAIVPPSQSERMVEALRQRGVPVAYLLFEGEQHGFRRAATIGRAMAAELYFCGRLLGFAPADRLEPIPIDNL